MADQQKVVHGLWNRAIFNDLERPQTQISRLGHYSTLNISEMAKETAISDVTIAGSAGSMNLGPRPLGAPNDNGNLN